MHVCFMVMVALLGVAYGAVVLKEASYLRLPNRNNQYVINSRTARESAYDDDRNYLYVVGRDTAMLHVISLADPANPQEVLTHSFQPAADGRPLDVELCRSSGVTPTLAITFDGQDSVTFEGHLVLYNLFESPTDTLTPLNPTDPRITVGAHPDNMKFTSDCRRLVVANEGEPRVVSGTFYDPEGTVSVITFSTTPGVLPVVTNLNFRKYDDDSELIPLLDQGVRYWLRRDPNDPIKKILFSQNVEPEYVAISPSNGFAYITLQENNAMARIDLENSVITSIYAMGNKSWELLSLDASDRDNGIVMTERNIRSFYQPDKVAFFSWGTNDIPYLVTTDEGRPTNIPGVTFQDYARAGSLTWNTDVDLESQLKSNANLGRLYVSNVDGFDVSPNVPYAFGGRGFSIWNTQSMTRIWESGNELERYSRQYFPDTFNGNSATFSQTPVQEMDSRSTWMGPEPNTVAVGDFNGKRVLVIGSGRNGMLYVYTLQPSVENPTPEFQSVHRAGAIDATWSVLYGREAMGDAIISDIKFSTVGTPKVIVTSEASGSVSVYTLADETWPPTNFFIRPVGRLYVSNVDGFDVSPNVPYAFGGRGFSILNTQSMTRIWESGDELERYSREFYPDTFNGDCASFSQTPVDQTDTRSTWIGPQVNSVAVEDVGGRSVMVLGSGRNGLLYLYSLQPSVDNPTPEFQSVYRAGATDATWTTLYARGDMGDGIISDIKMSRVGTPIVIVTSEASGSISVYTLADETWPPTPLDAGSLEDSQE